jgi:hypothetical protein
MHFAICNQAHVVLGRSISTSSAAPSSNVNSVSSILHDAARITDWNKDLALCKSSPACSSYAGRIGWEALNHACSQQCPHLDVAEALIKAYPAALLQEKEKGWLTLHYACCLKAPKAVVRVLLHMHPELGKTDDVAKGDHLGRTPLFYSRPL